MSSSPYQRLVVSTRANRGSSPRPEKLRDVSLSPTRRTRRALPPLDSQEERPERHTARPRQVNRPRARFLIDTRYPVFSPENPALKDIISVRPLRSHLPATTTRQQQPSNPIQSLSLEPNLVVINGTRTRKRRAEHNELELVAVHHGIEDHTPSIATPREGINCDNVDITEDIEVPPRMFTKIPFFGSITRMITGIRTAFTGLGEKFGRMIHHGSYTINELRSITEEGDIANKRRKVVQAEENEAKWIDQAGLANLIKDYKKFAHCFSYVWQVVRNAPSREAVNKILRPLLPVLADNPEDIRILNRGGDNDLCKLFHLQCDHAFNILERVYEIGRIVKLRNNNPVVPPIIDEHCSDQEIQAILRIRNLMSAPALATICEDILKLPDIPDFHNVVGVSTDFMDRIVLDMEAILNKLPLPSYIMSIDYHERMRERFPAPRRTDLNYRLLLPGTFPQTEESPAEQPPPEEHNPLPTPQPSSPAPIIAQTKTNKTELLRAQFLEEDIAQIEPGEFRSAFYKESEAHREIEKNYIVNFKPRALPKLHTVGTLKSVLKNRRKHSSRCTPKRMAIRCPPKAVRFTDSTRSPQPRTHTGLDVPRLINPEDDSISLKNEQLEESQPSQATPTEPHSLNFPETQLERDARERVLDSKELLEYEKVKALRMQAKYRRERKDEDGIDPTTRIEQLFALPSLQGLQISDDTKAGIAFKKEQVALKAAEKARKAAEEARRIEEEKARRELEERLARSGGLRTPRQPLVAPISDEWIARAKDTLRAGATTTLAKTGESVELRRHDFAKVVPPTEWLNDEIINGSLNWLDQAINSAAGIKDVKRQTRKCLTLSSFFFKRLQDQGVGRTQRTLRRYGVEKKNFLDVDTILLPICDRYHWTLLVVRPGKKTVAHMDSLNPRGSLAYTSLCLSWVKDILEETFDEDEWKVIRHESPMQVNGHDCGVHTITNAMCIALGLSPIDCYVAGDMPLQRIRIACMLLNSGFTGEFDLRLY